MMVPSFLYSNIYYFLTFSLSLSLLLLLLLLLLSFLLLFLLFLNFLLPTYLSLGSKATEPTIWKFGQRSFS